MDFTRISPICQVFILDFALFAFTIGRSGIGKGVKQGAGMDIAVEEQLQVPLYAHTERHIGVFDGLDHAVLGIGGHTHAGRRHLHYFVMEGIDAESQIHFDRMQQGALYGSYAVRAVIAARGLAVQDGRIAFGGAELAGKILPKVAAEYGIENLNAAADARIGILRLTAA